MTFESTRVYPDFNETQYSLNDVMHAYLNMRLYLSGELFEEQFDPSVPNKINGFANNTGVIESKKSLRGRIFALAPPDLYMKSTDQINKKLKESLDYKLVFAQLKKHRGENPNPILLSTFYNEKTNFNAHLSIEYNLDKNNLFGKDLLYSTKYVVYKKGVTGIINKEIFENYLKHLQQYQTLNNKIDFPVEKSHQIKKDIPLSTDHDVWDVDFTDYNEAIQNGNGL